jgi:hypothetical protein
MYLEKHWYDDDLQKYYDTHIEIAIKDAKKYVYTIRLIILAGCCCAPKRKRAKKKSSEYKQYRKESCEICGSTHNLDAHHRISRANGGDDSEENIETLCKSCHRTKHPELPDKFFRVDVPGKNI